MSTWRFIFLFCFFCMMFLEVLRQRSVFETILFSLYSLSVQLTPNSHENSKENRCPIIKKVGDLRNTKKDHPVVKIIQINFNPMTFTLTDDLDWAHTTMANIYLGVDAAVWQSQEGAVLVADGAHDDVSGPADFFTGEQHNLMKLKCPRLA